MKPPAAIFFALALCAAADSRAADAHRLVVLTTTAWDYVQELGLASEVVGRADNVEAPALKDTARVGRSDAVNLEAVAALHPDIVLGSPQYHAPLAAPLAGGGAKLELISIKKWEDVAAQLDHLAAALGVAAPKAVEERLAARMTAVAAPHAGGPRVAVIVNAEPLLVATAGSYSADLIRLAGGDAGMIPDAPGAQFRGFTQFSDEKLLELNPDAIILSRWRGVEQLDKALASKPFWKELKAVKAGAVKEIEAAQLYTVPGPRGVETVTRLRTWFESLPAQK